MKSRINSLAKDNLFCAVMLSAALFATAGSALAGNTPAAATAEIQRLDPIVVTARRGADVTLERVVITAPRVQTAG